MHPIERDIIAADLVAQIEGVRDDAAIFPTLPGGNHARSLIRVDIRARGRPVHVLIGVEAGQLGQVIAVGQVVIGDGGIPLHRAQLVVAMLQRAVDGSIFRDDVGENVSQHIAHHILIIGIIHKLDAFRLYARAEEGVARAIGSPIIG